MAYDRTQAHEKVKHLGWEPSYVKPEPKYQTRYFIPKKGRDPFRHLMRDYMKMQAEKDHRQFGFLDGAARMGNPNAAQERWIETMKVVCAAFPAAEYAAAKIMGLLIEVVDNAELRQGYLAQMLDEVRHYQQFMYLNRFFTKNYRDPEGFNSCMKRAGDNGICAGARSAAEMFCSNDPIEGALSLMVLDETAYTNCIFVGLPKVAALNGDHAVTSVMLSIQSDEARHMANGYATLVTLLGDDRNLPLLQESLDKYLWRLDRFVGAALGYVVDYGTVVKAEPYRKLFEEFVLDDWVGSYIAKLGKFGLRPPSCLEDVATNAPWVGHTTALNIYATWPLQFWRMEPPNDRDMEWFEHHYPNWHVYYGGFWEEAKRMADPANGALPMQLFAKPPPFCQVCLFPCVMPRPDISTGRVIEIDGKKRAFCSPNCQWMYELEPAKYREYVNLYERFDGWDLADVITELGYVRKDGKTLLAQPTLATDRMWTVDDIRRVGYVLENPLA